MKTIGPLFIALVSFATPAIAGDGKDAAVDPAKLLDAIQKGDWEALDEYLRHLRDTEAPAWKKLRLAPAAAPVPALRYRLLPELRDTKAGNAAVLYLRAQSHDDYQEWRKNPETEKLSEWLEMPLDKLPAERELPALPRRALDDIDRAARREYCAWEVTDQLREKGVHLPIPETQTLREMGQLLCLRARFELKAGRFDQALQTLQSVFQMGRHVGDGPTLIHSLVGIAISHVAVDTLEDWVQQPGGPNLYWALLDLPRPFVDLRRGFQGDRVAFESSLPGLREALHDPTTPPFTTKKIHDYLRLWTSLSGTKKVMGPAKKEEQVTADDAQFLIGLAIMSAKIYPEAKVRLLREGHTLEQVEAMPIVQVALLHGWAEYEELWDEMQKWINLPYWQAAPGLDKAEMRVKINRGDIFRRGGVPLASFLLPAAWKVAFAQARLERRLAALHCLEACRIHAAEHGKFPKALREVAELLIPIDPVGGKDFVYSMKGPQARLFAPPPQGRSAYADNILQYEWTLQPSGKTK